MTNPGDKSATLKVLGLYAAGSWLVLQIIDVLANNVGLPPSVFRLALILLLVGLPLVGMTAYLQGTGSGLFTWRNAIVGGVGALALLGVVAAAGMVWRVSTPDEFGVPTGAEDARSIAVLPLVNVGGDSTQEYFADGITEELANALGKVPGLRVAARTSSYAFKGRRDLDVREVGQALGVATVLQGSVRRAGGRLRVNVQLTDASERVELWSQSYDADVKDVFAVQDSITQATVSQLALQLGGDDLAAVRAGRTVNTEAHDLYLRGRVLAGEQTPSALRRALDYYREALAKDPDYPQAWAGMSSAYVAMADGFMPSHIAYDSARIAARHALERDSLVADAHASLGFASMALDWSFETGEQQLRRALELDPNSVWTLILYGWYLCTTGRFDEGLALADRSISLDRLSPVAGWPRDVCLYSARRYDELIADLEATVAVDPDFWYWDAYPAAAYREEGRMQEALAEYGRLQQLAGEEPLFGYAITYARNGQAAEAREILGQLEALSRAQYVNPLSIALIYASLDQNDEAFEWLERAVEDRTVFLFGLVTWADFDPLGEDPRLGQLIERIGLPAPR